jgi:hypothetical protein
VNFIGSRKEEELMENRKVKHWAEMIAAVAFWVLILMAMVPVVSVAVDRATQGLAWVSEKLNENPRQRATEEIRERWRVTRPGMLLSKDFVPMCEAPGIRALIDKEDGRPGSRPLRQAGGSHINP